MRWIFPCSGTSLIKGTPCIAQRLTRSSAFLTIVHAFTVHSLLFHSTPQEKWSQIQRLCRPRTHSAYDLSIRVSRVFTHVCDEAIVASLLLRDIGIRTIDEKRRTDRSPNCTRSRHTLRCTLCFLNVVSYIDCVLTLDAVGHISHSSYRFFVAGARRASC
jgi:hypothetical protein